MNTKRSERDSTRIVITDANVLINLFIANDLALLSRIPGCSFAVCAIVQSPLAQLQLRSMRPQRHFCI